MTDKNGAMSVNEIFFELLRLGICGAELEGVKCLSERELSELYQVANAHDMAHLVSSALHKCGLLGDGEASLKFQKKQLQAVYRTEQIKYALGEVCGAFEDARIPYMLLKGSVIRPFYPEEWMRTSCDIDVLVHKEDIERSISALVATEHWKTDGKRDYHDVSLYSKNAVHLELHFNIKENKDNIDGLLSEVWEHSKRANENSFRYEQTNEYFVFHHIAHMSYHFLSGGCGIKPFVDLYVIKNKLSYDDNVVREYLRRSGIEKFYDSVLCVTDAWFEEKSHTPISLQMEEYILKGGVYGTLENRVALAQNKKGSKARYILSRVFLPYDALKIHYPFLEKHKWLFPFMQIARWLRLFKKEKFKRGLREVKLSNSVSENEAAEIENFLESIGL